jgi:hypothetical protein
MIMTPKIPPIERKVVMKATATLAILLGLALPAAAQTEKPAIDQRMDQKEEEGDFRIGPSHPVKEIFLDLEGPLPQEFPSKRLLVRVSDSGKKVWLLPVYIVKDLKRPSGSDQVATLTIVDALYHPDMEAVIHKAMDAKYKVWEKANPINNQAEITLWSKEMIETSRGKKELRAPLSRFVFLRDAGSGQQQISFSLSASDAKRLSDPACRLGVTWSEEYRGRFTRTDLEGTLRISNATAARFGNSLDTDTKGEKATLFVAIGGGVDQRLAVQQYFVRQVSIEVLTREGKDFNQALVERVAEKMFANLAEETSLAKQREDTVVTFLVGNILKMTASIGTFKGIKDQLRKDAQRLTESTNALRTRNRLKTDIESSGLFGIAGLNLRLDNESERDSTKSDKLETRDLLELVKAIEGDLPVAVLNAKQLQTLAARAQTNIEFDVGAFHDGRKSLESHLSLAPSTQVANKLESDPRRAILEVHADLKKASERLAEARKARDFIAAELEVAKVKLAYVRGKAAHARGLAEKAQNELDQARGELKRIREERIRNLSRPFPAPYRERGLTVEQQVDKHLWPEEIRLRLPELTKEAQKKRQEAAPVESEVRLLESAANPAMLTQADEKFKKLAAEVAKLEALLGKLLGTK